MWKICFDMWDQKKKKKKKLLNVIICQKLRTYLIRGFRGQFILFIIFHYYYYYYYYYNFIFISR
jgi:hypothetical protein